MNVLRLSLPLTLGLVLTIGLIFFAGRSKPGQAAEGTFQEANIRYVAVSGADIGDCSDSSSPCRTPQYGVDQAMEGDEVRVAAWVYTGVVQYNDNIPVLLWISKTATLQGGYSELDWSHPTPDDNPTILDAQQQGRVILIQRDVDTVPISPTISGFHIRGGISDNSVPDYFLGGGILNIFHHVTILDNEIYSNTAVYQGGGMGLWGPALVENNIIRDNYARFGGGIYMAPLQSIVEVVNNEFVDNWAEGEGGAIYSHGAHSLGQTNIISHNRIISNTAEGSGGGIFLSIDDTINNNLIVGNESWSFGGAMSIADASPEINHNTFVGNVSHLGGGIVLWTGSINTPFEVTFVNNIFAKHPIAIFVSPHTTATLEANLWGTGQWANEAVWGGWGTGTVITNSTNIWDNPGFIDPANGDYHIEPDSAARDAGVDAGVYSDIDGQICPYGAGFDIGADELAGSFDLSKTANHDLIASGERLTYTLAVTNTGAFTLHATITDTLPVVVQPSGVLTWTPTITAPSGVWRLTIPVTVNTGISGWLANELEVTTDDGLSAAVVALVRAEEPISGLAAANDSPTVLGWDTTLTATIASGSRVSYSWDIGDASFGAGPVITHTYSQPGVYTAVVTATNALSAVAATTPVTITNAPPPVFLPVILRQAVPTTNPYPLDGSTLLNNGLCCAGGYYGDLITLTVSMTATSPITEVTQMRHASRRGSSCFTQEELAAYPWVPYATQVLIPIEINFSNWIGFYAGVQFRDAAGFLSPPLCDDISIEGMPPPPELKPSPIIHLWFSRLSPFGFSGNPQTGSPFNYRDTVPIPFSRSS